MNSADIRDTDLGQWAYWATALPVTAVVMLLGLVFTGEMRRLRGWTAERLAVWITSVTKENGRSVDDKGRERDWRETERR